MYRFITLLVIIAVTNAEMNRTKTITKCNDISSNYSTKKVLGTWYVVATVPEKSLPDSKQITCYKVEFCEPDLGGLRWLVNRTATVNKPSLLKLLKGTVIRQHYHSVPEFDVWSRSVEGVRGCFQQVLSMDTEKGELDKAPTHDAMMQLHLLETNDGSGPFLLQLLWGRMISVVIYRRTQGVTPEQLKPVEELITKLRGPQLLPRICDTQLKDILGF